MHMQRHTQTHTHKHTQTHTHKYIIYIYIHVTWIQRKQRTLVQHQPPVVTIPEARCPNDNIHTQSGLKCEKRTLSCASHTTKARCNIRHVLLCKVLETWRQRSAYLLVLCRSFYQLFIVWGTSSISAAVKNRVFRHDRILLCSK